MLWFKKKKPTFKNWIKQGYCTVADYKSRAAYLAYEEWMNYSRKMTLNEFLKEHPGYGMLQVTVDRNDIIKVYPTDRTNMTLDLVKECQSRDPFFDNTAKTSAGYPVRGGGGPG